MSQVGLEAIEPVQSRTFAHILGSGGSSGENDQPSVIVANKPTIVPQVSGGQRNRYDLGAFSLAATTHTASATTISIP
jgi:hypothetical protein